MNYIKKFFEWIVLKRDLDKKNHKPPYVPEGEIWWASIGENVGAEINGKSRLFSRPVIVLKKLSKGFYFVVPTTTQVRNGNWYVVFYDNKFCVTACLHQARPVDYRRFYSKLGELDKSEFDKLKKGFESLYL